MRQPPKNLNVPHTEDADAKDVASKHTASKQAVSEQAVSEQAVSKNRLDAVVEQMSDIERNKSNHLPVISSSDSEKDQSLTSESIEHSKHASNRDNELNDRDNTPDNHLKKRKKTKSKNQNNALIWADFKWLMTWVVLGGSLGAYAGELAWGIVIGMTAFYIWQSYAMEQFYIWLSRSVTLPPPDFSGSLSFIANQMYESKKQEELTHQKTMGLIKKIRASLLALQDAVILLDKNDSLEWWNQSAENLLELRSEDQGRSILELINIQEFHDYYDKAGSLNEGVRLQSWRNAERFLQCEVTHFGKEKLLIIYDVTRLQHLEQMRKDFVGNVSHELRTPLTVLMGYIETFSDQEDLDPKWQRGFTLMSQQTKRMNSIINDLLLLSRLENEEVHEKQCVNIPRLLVNIFDDAQIYNRDYNHLIDLHIDSQKNLYGSETYLNSALLNLVVNAIKYTPKNGEIDISWQEVKGGCLFSVSDNGIGISKEHIERLTERFYRVDDGRSRATGGTGLGLAIVKHVLYQHNATLTIESTKDKGSTFNVFFPNQQVCGDNPQLLPDENEFA